LTAKLFSGYFLIGISALNGVVEIYQIRVQNALKKWVRAEKTREKFRAVCPDGRNDSKNVSAHYFKVSLKSILSSPVFHGRFLAPPPKLLFILGEAGRGSRFDPLPTSPIQKT
jgi:hypothetical protein